MRGMLRGKHAGVFTLEEEEQSVKVSERNGNQPAVTIRRRRARQWPKAELELRVRSRGRR